MSVFAALTVVSATILAIFATTGAMAIWAEGGRPSRHVRVALAAVAVLAIVAVLMPGGVTWRTVPAGFVALAGHIFN